MLAIPVALAATLYARFFAGYWLGDDFGALASGLRTAQQGETLRQAWAHLFAPAASEGAFYRPAMSAAVLFNAALAGTRFAGWFAVNFAMHLANVVLVAIAVATLARACGRDGRLAGVVAACLFAACPLLAEGVFWISARADAAVTLLTLAAMLAWVRAHVSVAAACAVPLCVLAALGFKESAAVFPLQIALVAFAWPSRPARGQIASIVACFAFVALFFAMRAHLFGDIWHVYPTSAVASPDERFRHAIASLLPWWRGLSRSAPAAGTAYVVALAIAMATVLLATRGGQRLLAAALFMASVGLCAATLMNLGGMNPSGEGGRLAYSPFAWLALALGVASAKPLAGADRPATSASRRAGVAALVAATIIGTFVLERELRDAHAAQDQLHALAQATREWAALHPGLTLLVIDGARGRCRHRTQRARRACAAAHPAGAAAASDAADTSRGDRVALRPAAAGTGDATRRAASIVRRCRRPAAACRARHGALARTLWLLVGERAPDCRASGARSGAASRVGRRSTRIRRALQ